MFFYTLLLYLFYACPHIIHLSRYNLRASYRHRLRHVTCVPLRTLPVPLYSPSAAMSFGWAQISRAPPASPSRSAAPPPHLSSFTTILPVADEVRLLCTPVPFTFFLAKSEQAFSYFVGSLSRFLSPPDTLLHLVVHQVGTVLFRLQMVRYRSGLLPRETPGYKRVRTV